MKTVLRIVFKTIAVIFGFPFIVLFICGYLLFTMGEEAYDNTKLLFKDMWEGRGA